MMSDKEAIAGSFFKCSNRDRAAFEAGIKMATVYHQFIGTPVSKQNVEILEKAIEETIKIQPYVESVRVSISREGLGNKEDQYTYSSLSGKMLDVNLVISLSGVRVSASMHYIPELDYPLMFVESVEEI
ncbi:MAG: dihydroneopterin aldolase [Candidatus Methanomethylophilaceae archaeon]|nr:dihydroneopterin aldolase [Candidatus Methanomethylophilaceae archaeon]MDI3541920.1 dihydroneopterin aldolase [Candidatus Methanomethylophilaceae archaeon]